MPEPAERVGPAGRVTGSAGRRTRPRGLFSADMPSSAIEWGCHGRRAGSGPARPPGRPGTPRAEVGGEQGLDLAAELGVVAAGLVQISGPGGRRRVGRGRRERLVLRSWAKSSDMGPRRTALDSPMRNSLTRKLANEFFRIFPPPPPRRRRSQARAYAQWRPAVARDSPSAAAASRERQPGEVAELDEIGLERVLGRQPGQGLVQGEQVFARLGAGGRSGSSSSRRGRPPCLAAAFRRAGSTRMRRMASAAAAKKWPRLSQRAPSAGPTSRSTPRGRGPSRSGCCRGLRRPCAAASFGKLVVDERQEVGGRLAVPGRGGVQKKGHVWHAGILPDSHGEEE